ncbi:MAG: class I SAM-dependent methyltransferase [Pseudomonadota bacterium]
MTQTGGIIELHPWLDSPAGRLLQQWEQAELDRAVADIFGFHALQLGLPELDALRANRMAHRWIALDHAYAAWPVRGETALGASPVPREACAPAAHRSDVPIALRCDFHALPFPANSLDLVVLPHALELASDPHETLREVERVLVPDGRVVIIGFNPASLWGAWQRAGRWGARSACVLPQGEFIGYWRLRDWLRLLGLQVETGCFGCYRPAWRSERWLDRLAWMERVGERWWPVLGGVYFIVAVKRVRGMRLVGKLKRAKAATHAAPAVLTNRH